MRKIYRFLGKKGRTTIPFAIRQSMELKPNDLISFTQEDDAVIIAKEKICDGCADTNCDYEDDMSISEFLDTLTDDEQREALIHLSVKWATQNSNVR